MQRILDSIIDATRDIFPETVAILHWGGAARRKKVSPVGDIDILVIVAEGTPLRAEDVQKLKSRMVKHNLDPYAIAEDGLWKDDITATGPGGPYEMHKMIHYQLKHESEVIYGHQKTPRQISQVTLKAALLDTIPHVKENMVDRMLAELDSTPEQKFIADNLDVLLVVARCIYSVEGRGIVTKEEALGYLARQHKEMKRLMPYLQNRYMRTKSHTYPELKKDLRTLLVYAQELFDEFLTK